MLTNPLNAPEPANNAGTVFVEVMTWQSGSGDNGYRLIQRLYGYGTSGSIANRVWVRTRTTGWGDWYELYSQANKPTAADVGAIVREDAPVGIPHPWPLVTARWAGLSVMVPPSIRRCIPIWHRHIPPANYLTCAVNLFAGGTTDAAWIRQVFTGMAGRHDKT